MLTADFIKYSNSSIETIPKIQKMKMIIYKVQNPKIHES
tara:strand:+ start:289 stop:405 length:117 start_codon:yes stop_codon:yes gene_type:complete